MIGGIPIPYTFIVFGMLFLLGMATADKTLMAVGLICTVLAAYQMSLGVDKALDERRNSLAGCTGLLEIVGMARAITQWLF